MLPALGLGLGVGFRVAVSVCTEFAVDEYRDVPLPGEAIRTVAAFGAPFEVHRHVLGAVGTYHFRVGVCYPCQGHGVERRP